MAKENLVLTLEGEILYHTTETPSKRIVYAVGIDSEDGDTEDISIHAQNINASELESMVEGILDLYIETLMRSYEIPEFLSAPFIADKLNTLCSNSYRKVFENSYSNDEN